MPNSNHSKQKWNYLSESSKSGDEIRKLDTVDCIKTLCGQPLASLSETYSYESGILIDWLHNFPVNGD
jgi:hypothetical protein